MPSEEDYDFYFACLFSTCIEGSYALYRIDKFNLSVQFTNNLGWVTAVAKNHLQIIQGGYIPCSVEKAKLIMHLNPYNYSLTSPITCE